MPRKPASSSHSPTRPQALANWLLFVALMVLVMVTIGGITRLTESGLSIVEWEPLKGALPPMSQAAWEAEFEAYKKIPEYIEVNGPAGMDLAAFKQIYFWEWFHRLWGRLIGLAFALPLAWFWIKRAIPQGYKPRLLALLALGALQGSAGWWMVTSGLTERTDVSHFRLATHLLIALFTLGGLVWTALDLKAFARRRSARPARLTGFATLVLAGVTLQLLLGAWVAGLDAGYIARDWPLMNGTFLPAGIDWSRGPWFAFTHDPFLLHFLHRWWAWGVVVLLVLLARRVKAKGSRPASIAIHSSFGTQILLGIATVMSGMAITFAVLHQAVGALVVAATVWGAHVIGRKA
ncbi:COX15/CtaA family protein [Pseudoblastomonas halimionae]|uniref:Heme A synthase n=1 Tax=Alteriqipengyuania halimionae TaxID=1926630 RepID=A0A6I4U8K6_9SPHN|nr:COX15/CtaA family protein [Alteriqipengyuania halimionae]MXP10812.1 heme A synthase [Alteriqipengyuania halimionae]